MKFLKKINKKRLYGFSFLALLLFNIFFIYASHNTSRYFPFLERSAEYTLRRQSHVSSSFFYANGDTAFSRGGGTAGIPELYGKYDLRDVIASLKKVKGNSFVNPIEEERGSGDVWLDKSVLFKVNGKLKARGIILNYKQCFNFYAQRFNLKGLSLGVSLPLMYVNTSENYYFYPDESDNVFKNLRLGELDQLNRIRRKTNDELGLLGGDWTKSGIGDFDLHIGLNFNWDYKWLIRNIDLNFRLGTTVPTGVNSNINYASSVSFMSNGFWSLYFDILPEFELKQDWRVGLMLGTILQFDNTRRLRIPIYQEPALFSALVSDVKIDPGVTFKFSPYFVVENLTDGVDFQFRYTYLRHADDTWMDARDNPIIKSYLNQEVGTEIWAGNILTQENISSNIATKKDLTRWRMHYISFELTYNSKNAGNNWVLDPKFFVIFDYQFSGNSSCKTHQLTLGLQANF